MATYIDKERGSVFAGQWPDTYAWVPDRVLADEQFDKGQYLTFGWGHRNHRANGAETPGEIVLPDLTQPVEETEPAVQRFLSRLQNDSGVRMEQPSGRLTPMTDALAHFLRNHPQAE